MKNKIKYLKIRSRNSSCEDLRNEIPTNNNRIVFRLGSTTSLEDIFHTTDLSNVHEINKVEACVISGNKVLMKKAFTNSGIKTAEWNTFEELCILRNGEVILNNDSKILNKIINKNNNSLFNIIDQCPKRLFPLIVKKRNSSGGNGIYQVSSMEQLAKLYIDLNISLNPNTYIVEKYYGYLKEYRIHVTRDKYFYAARKMLKSDATERWHRHDSNCVWILEENPSFDKPENWNIIVEEAIKSLKSVGLDIGAIDIKVQSKNKINPEFIILETNSAPALGEVGLEKYKIILTEIINNIK